LLVGGLFVHLPFLVRRSATEGDRISSFRATEELMLRCGSAFTEVLFLGKSIDEVRGVRFFVCCPLLAHALACHSSLATRTASARCFARWIRRRRPARRRTRQT
jgi:hypothetical protein